MRVEYRCATLRSTGQIAGTVCIYLWLWFSTLYPDELALPWMLVASITIGLFTVRLFNLQHDCAHRSYFKTRLANDVVGSLLSIATLTPHFYWRMHHLTHHGTSGNLDRRGKGEILLYTVEEFIHLSVWRRMLYRAYRNPLLFLLLGPLFHFVIKMRLPYIAAAGTRERRSIHFVNVIWLAIYAVLFYVYPHPEKIITIHLVSFLLAGAIGLWLFFVQHQFEGTYWRRTDQWNFREASIKGSSYLKLPAPAAWFFAHINLHHVHHLDPKVPNYHLRAKLRNCPIELSNELSVRESLAAFGFKLWDERAQKMVGFPKGSKGHVRRY